jgi:hypothetical protein
MRGMYTKPCVLFCGFSFILLLTCGQANVQLEHLSLYSSLSDSYPTKPLSESISILSRHIIISRFYAGRILPPPTQHLEQVPTSLSIRYLSFPHESLREVTQGQNRMCISCNVHLTTLGAQLARAPSARSGGMKGEICIHQPSLA